MQTQQNIPAVFLPGTLCDERVWLPVWRKMQLDSKTYVPLQWAENLDHMLALTADRVDQFSSKVDLVGYSLGGYIASLYALEHPENVASLTLIGYNSDGLTKPEMQQRAAILSAIKSGAYSGMTRLRLKQFVDNSHADNPEVTDTVIQMSEDLGAATLRCQIQATTPRKVLTGALAKTAFPKHIIGAENDLVAPLVNLQKMHSTFNHSRLTMVKDAAHMMLLEQPEKLASIIEASLTTK